MEKSQNIGTKSAFTQKKRKKGKRKIFDPAFYNL